MSGTGSPGPRRLLAGSSANERSPARRDPDEPRWFEPPHVRDPATARSRIADQVAAGADIVTAPTWRTHRRALLDVAETRRAREWTLAAVTVTREGVEEGLERRDALESRLGEEAPLEEASETGDRAAPRLERPARPAPLVAGALPALDEEPEPASGRLLPRDAASERDYRDQAGLLADANVDLILVELRPDGPMTRVAVEAAAATGLPAWAAAATSLAAWAAAIGADPSDARRADSLRRWAEACVDAGADLLLAGGPAALTVLPDATDRPWGGLVDAELGSGSAGSPADEVSPLLEAGAVVVGLLDGAAPERLAALREAIDAVAAADLQAGSVARRRWQALLAEAAGSARGGAALWLAQDPPADPPVGFDWSVVARERIRGLPHGRFRLIVDPDGSVGGHPDLPDLLVLLEDRGVLVRPVRAGERGVGSLRLARLDEATEPPLALYRRED